MPPDLEKRYNVVSAQFALKMYQDWTIPAGGGYHSNELRLEVRDANGDSYVLSPDISGHDVLLAKLLRRIAATKGQPGWKFDADWDPVVRRGEITGPTGEPLLKATSLHSFCVSETPRRWRQFRRPEHTSVSAVDSGTILGR